MNSLAVKFQKARRMIARNGLKSGGKIVAGYFWNYFKSFFAGSGDILFIAGGIGDKAHYRAFGIAEELEAHGFKCAVTVADNFRLVKYASRFKVFIFNKVSHSVRITALIDEIKRQNKEIIFDTDDLDFDPRYLTHMDYFSKITKAEKEEYEKGIGAQILNDSYVKVATTPVSYLAEKIREKGKQVFVVSNKVSNYELEVADRIVKEGKAKDDFIRIGYYSGTLSHNKDFATVSDVLIEIFEKYKNVKLVLAGLLDIEDKLKKYEGKIETLPRVSRDEYYKNVYKCDINIVPLELGNPFCESKSEIKFIEAGILGIPTVVAGNQTFSEAIIDGQDGFLAKTRQDWVDKIGCLIENSALRLEMGRRAREKVLADYSVKNSHQEEYYAFLRSKLKQ